MTHDVTYVFVSSFSEFSGQEIRSSVVFNPLEGSSVAVEEEDSELKGAVVGIHCNAVPVHKLSMVPFKTREIKLKHGVTCFCSILKKLHLGNVLSVTSRNLHNISV